MTLIYLSIVLGGLGLVVWLFFQENRKEARKQHPSLMERLGLNEGARTPAEAKSKLLTQEFETPTPQAKAEFQPTPDPEPTIQFAQDPELIAKYEKLESLLKEKGEEIDKRDRALESELKAKKEFNKVKDIFEKELKDSKDKSHKLQLELGAAQAETENYKRHIIQLEEKIKTKERDIRQKEKEIDELVRRIQAFAATPQPTQPQTSTPTTSSTVRQEQSTPHTETQQQPPALDSPQEKKQPEEPIPNETPEKPQPSEPQPTEPTETKPDAPKEKKFAQGEPIRQPPKDS